MKRKYFYPLTFIKRMDVLNSITEILYHNCGGFMVSSGPGDQQLGLDRPLQWPDPWAKYINDHIPDVINSYKDTKQNLKLKMKYRKQKEVIKSLLVLCKSLWKL